jgi:hypothetical protein
MGSAAGVVRSVGPGQPYAKPCQAFAAAQDGDVIEIDAAGNYDGDVCTISRNNLTIRGVNGRAHIDAAGQYAASKGIWVVAGDNIVIENIEFSGAKVPDRNGAGIRLDSGNLTVRNCVFHNNENGILGGFYGRVLIEHSEFYDNGYGDGYSHNIYVNSGVAEFVLQYSASRRAKAGHLVKSRAVKNFILYNRLTQESGTGSYELDLPSGGVAYVIGNVFQQGDTTQNRSMISYGMEGLLTGRPHELYVVNNTFHSTRSAGATFVQITSSMTTPAVIRNNIFSGSGIVTTQSTALLAGNVTSGNMGFLDPSQFDFRISNLSAALNAGVDPGSAGGFSLRPVMQYKHPLCAVPRTDVGPIDAGAYEYGVIEANAVCASHLEAQLSPATPPAAPQLQSFTVSASTVSSGNSFRATVTLSSPAPAGGTAVVISSMPAGVVTTPASITIAAGTTTASITVTAGQVSSPTVVVLTATLSGLSLTATVTVKPIPTVGTLSPVAGEGSNQTFSFSFSHPQGWQNLNVVNVLINDVLDGRRACYLAYVRPLNVLYLVNDTGDSLLPGLLLSGGGSLSNGQCTIIGAGTTASGVGTSMTLTVNIKFSSSFAGNKIVYVAARDLEENSSGWVPAGVWGVPGATITSPAVGTVTPASGAGSAQTFTFTFSDANGWQELGVLNILINDSLDGRHACYLAYSRPQGALYLVSDSGDTLLPELRLGTSGSVSNSQCTVYGMGSSLTASGTTLTLTLNMAFGRSFVGDRIIYMAARDVAERTSGWRPKGKWRVQ